MHCYYVVFSFFFLLRTAGTIIGRGIAQFITDWDKVSATVSVTCSQCFRKKIASPVFFFFFFFFLLYLKLQWFIEVTVYPFSLIGVATNICISI